jgi:hypothetical protein
MAAEEVNGKGRVACNSTCIVNERGCFEDTELQPTIVKQVDGSAKVVSLARAWSDKEGQGWLARRSSGCLIGEAASFEGEACSDMLLASTSKAKPLSSFDMWRELNLLESAKRRGWWGKFNELDQGNRQIWSISERI